MFGGNFAPAGWALCNGQLLSIAQNSVLFDLLGTTYGGDGQTTFAVPDLQGRFPVCQGQAPGLGNYLIGQKGGQEAVNLVTNQLPVHSHPAACSTQGSGPSPVSKVWATDPSGNIAPYSTQPPNGQMNAQALSNSGGGLQHDNMQPFLAVTFIISLLGIFPSQS